MNNDYSNKTTVEYIKKLMTNKHTAENKNKEIDTTHLNLNYKSQYYESYNTNERIMRKKTNNIKSTKK